jgi:hypothetical protein
MQLALSRKSLAFLVTGSLFALGAAFAGCGGSSSNSATPAATNDGSVAGETPDSGGSGSDASSTSDGPAGIVSTTPGSCANPTVLIDFSPMYSAYIPGSTLHSFQIPAITDDGNQATWSVSDSTQAILAPESFNGSPGVLITVIGSGTGSDGGEGALGQVTVIATEADGSCGTSVLTITSDSEMDWTIGSLRYNNDVTITVGGGGGGGIMRLPDGGFVGPDGGPVGPPGGGAVAVGDGGSIYERDGGTACTNCHGPTATTGPYRMVSHTPEQTGGFSDTDLIGIFTQGMIPDGGYFDPAVINAACDGGGPPVNLPDGGTATCTELAYATWSSFHRWADITPDQYAGVIVYLRSLQPLPQNGSPGANFGRGAGGGGRRGDGGVFPRPDGGRGMGGPPGGGTDASALDASELDVTAPDADILDAGPDAVTE